MKNSWFYILIFFTVGCTQNKDSFYAMVNDNFLTFTDTVAYKNHSLFLIPNDSAHTYRYNSAYRLYINTDNDTTQIKQNELLNVIAKNNLSSYLNVIKKGQRRSTSTEISMIKNKGKYELVATKNRDQDLEGSVGMLQFLDVYTSTTNAVLLVLKQSSPKAGVIDAYFMKKDLDIWSIEKKIEMIRW